MPRKSPFNVNLSSAERQTLESMARKYTSPFAEISGATLWRWLSSDALRPWKHRSWIFPRDPNLAGKAEPILDLYQRVWEGAPLSSDDYVICADEKTSIQARRRKQPTLPPAPNRLDLLGSLGMSIEQGSSAAVKSKVELLPSIGLWGEVMGQEPYKSTRGVFWIMDVPQRILICRD
jgi:hypothetical protein